MIMGDHSLRVIWHLVAQRRVKKKTTHLIKYRCFQTIIHLFRCSNIITDTCIVHYGHRDIVTLFFTIIALISKHGQSPYLESIDKHSK